MGKITIPSRYLALLFALASVTNVYTQEGYFSGNAWEGGTATFHFDFEGLSPSGRPWNEAAQSALQEWNEATSFRFESVQEEHLPCLNGGTLDDWHSDGVNSIAFSNAGCDHDMGDSIGMYLISDNALDGERDERGFARITEADLLLNHNLNWDIFNGTSSGKLDFKRTVLALLGNSLGLSAMKFGLPGERYNRPFSILAQPSFISYITVADRNLVNRIYGGEVIHFSKYFTSPNENQIRIVIPEDSIVETPTGRVHISGDLADAQQLYGSLKVNRTEDQQFYVYEYSIQEDSYVDITVSSDVLEPEIFFSRVDQSRDIRGGVRLYGDNGQDLKVSGEYPAGTYWIGLFVQPGLESGVYDVELEATSLGTDNNSKVYTSIHGAEIKATTNSGIKGSLESSDFNYRGQLVDFYEVSIRQQQNFYFYVEADDFRPGLYIASIGSGEAIDDLTTVRVGDPLLHLLYYSKTLYPGTYWIGVANQVGGEKGDYQLHISSDL